MKPRTEKIRAFARDHRDELKVFGYTAGLAFFFTHGLPLWDDDYRLWMAQAHEGFFNLLLRLILPVTSEPGTWGYGDRPAQAAAYRVLSIFFGTWGTAYFFLKSVAFGGLCVYLYRWLVGSLRVSREIAALSIGIFAVSTNALVALLWHSDFSVYSLLGVSALFVWARAQLARLPHSGYGVYVDAYRKGLKTVPRDFLKFIGLFFAAVYFGSKFRGDFRLVPLVLAATLFVYQRGKFRAYLPPLALTFLATLPWSKAMFERLPPFVPGADASAYQGWTYAAFTFSRLLEFIGTDLIDVTRAPLSVLGALGITTVLALLGYAGYLISRRRLARPDETQGFLLFWLGFAILGCSILSRDSGQIYELRYTILPLVPATLLLGLALEGMMVEIGKSGRTWVRTALLAAVCLHGGMQLYRDQGIRRDVGRSFVAIDRAYGRVELFHPTARLALLPGFRNYGYRGSLSSALSERRALGAVDEISHFPAGTTYALSWNTTLDPRFTLAKIVSGCGYSLFDVVFPCGLTEGAMLLQYVGNVSEVVQADQFDRQGNLIAARDTLESYVRRDPGNHGAAFILSLYNYRLKNFGKMEQIYERIGPYFPNHTAVTYNWGLSKQSNQKYREASELLERAYSMVPKDYGVGFNLAESYFKQGKKSRALATLAELMQRYPEDAAMRSVHAQWTGSKTETPVERVPATQTEIPSEIPPEIPTEIQHEEEPTHGASDAELQQAGDDPR